MITAAFTSKTTTAEETPKDTVRKGLDAIFTSFDASAAERLFADDYIQHNTAIPTGRASIIGLLAALKQSGIRMMTHRLIAEGDLVVAHNTFDNAKLFGFDRMVTFDLFRVKDGRIVEHWDNIAPIAAPNPSGRNQVDGPTEIVDLSKTAANRALVKDFITTILINGDMARLTAFFDGDNYAQHNSQISDGLTGLGSALKALASQGITIKYTTVHKICAEGNFVFAASEGTLGGKPTAFFDLFRVDNGKIAEHWDLIAEIPTKMAHGNGKF
jgi:predicted SnoaL-like aldol condensation-catalyzing enzyme